ncbi:vesicle-associated membrane protein, putative [Entamoeba invadens IP1]|uniref:Vesicle-associated membrane protein, putative n=1 Tax=Entamoeba invadens IP1 TaxID=370355 RepID=A0A0A1U424_ENTIV|nr:vesicle-associated membrane protein, putative [Entamoeba invadens IP1]ELP88993.1 vesicle-associated membrane protein, putative [Entamoeba invadens IP1]|eukprot:XP_004255764.1 vesicle-associated membrane protein, putative [Entamoeba invadens IP1]
MSNSLRQYDPGPNILYCSVSYKTTILAEYYEVLLPGSDEIIKQILSKPTSGKNFIVHEPLKFCMLTTDVVTVMTIIGITFPQDRAFDFIDDVVVNFSKLFNTNKLDTLPPRSLNNTFAPMLKQKISHFNDLTNDPLNKIQQTLDQTVTKVNENVDKMLDRGNDLDNLQGESEMLLRDSESMFNNSVELKRKFQRRNIKLYIAFAMFIFFVVFIGSWVFCGVRFQRCRRA